MNRLFIKRATLHLNRLSINAHNRFYHYGENGVYGYHPKQKSTFERELIVFICYCCFLLLNFCRCTDLMMSLLKITLASNLSIEILCLLQRGECERFYFHFSHKIEKEKENSFNCLKSSTEIQFNRNPLDNSR